MHGYIKIFLPVHGGAEIYLHLWQLNGFCSKIL